MDKEEFLEQARGVARDLWTSELEIILELGYDTHSLFSKKKFKCFVLDDCGEKAPNGSLAAELESAIRKYTIGSRRSVFERVSNAPGTLPDTAVSVLLGARLRNKSPEELGIISDHHRTSMAAENLLGSLLEEYLSIYLKHHGFLHCAGEVLRSIDFIAGNGCLFQVKNSDNSENSSSSKVREGTEIKKWYRRKSTGRADNWSQLHRVFGIMEEDWQNEESFREFIVDVVSRNPRLLYVEGEESPPMPATIVRPKPPRSKHGRPGPAQSSLF